jgi:hypothetical protein
MEALLSELAEFKKMLDTNVTCDWDCAELTPGEEFSELATQLQTLIDKHTRSDRDIAIENLSHFICDDDVDATYDRLVAQAEVDGSADAWDFCIVYEPYENDQLTVDQILAMEF